MACYQGRDNICSYPDMRLRFENRPDSRATKARKERVFSFSGLNGSDIVGERSVVGHSRCSLNMCTNQRSNPTETSVCENTIGVINRDIMIKYLLSDSTHDISTIRCV